MITTTYEEQSKNSKIYMGQDLCLNSAAIEAQIKVLESNIAFFMTMAHLEGDAWIVNDDAEQKIVQYQKALKAMKKALKAFKECY